MFQEDEEGVRHPVGFWSRSLLPPERNYSASERECLAVIWVVQILRPYIENTTFTVFTDHAALRWMFNLSDASNRLARWRLRLLEFDFEIKYRKGANNTVADAISRLPTYGHTNRAADLDIPCLNIELSSSKLAVVHHVDSASLSLNDWDPCHCPCDAHLARLRNNWTNISVLSERESLNAWPWPTITRFLQS